MARELLPPDLHVDMGPIGVLRLELSLSEERRRVAREELRETDDVVPSALAELRRLITEERDKGLKAPLDDRFLTSFLRPCHWYPESALQRVRRYFSWKATYPRIARPTPFERTDAVIGSGILYILPRRDQHGRRILLLQTGRLWNHKKMPVDDILAGVLKLTELSMQEPDSQVAGSVTIWDVDGLTLPQALKFTPSVAKKVVTLIQECVPLRVKGYHFVNEAALFDIAFSIIKPLLNEKLRKLVFFHGKDWESLARHIDPEVLPVQYGGKQELHVDLQHQVVMFRSLDPFYQELAKYGYDKSPK